MTSTVESRQVKVVEGLQNGNGKVYMEHLLGPDELLHAGRLYAKVILPPTSSIGYHEHQAESETYYILSGEGTYNDNGKEMSIKTGDVTYTGSGFGHGIENTGEEDLVFMALIIFHKD